MRHTQGTAEIWDRARLADPHGQPDKAPRVRAMFDEIAPTYELVNRVLSMGRDAYWRRTAVALAGLMPAPRSRSGSACSRSGSERSHLEPDRVLDVACGTGDFSRAFAKASPALVVGCDFSERMLALAAARSQGGPDAANHVASAPRGRRGLREAAPIQRRPRGGDATRGAAQAEAARPECVVPQTSFAWCRGDALALPFADESFTAVGCAFGLRNLQDLPQGLAEAYRVLKPGGRAVILEFAVPRTPLLGRLYLLYFRRVLPRLAAWISRDRSGAYRYLPSSVLSFAKAEDMIALLRAGGFARVEHHPLTMGIVTVLIAWKDA